MTVAEMINQLSKYPENIELKDIPVRLAVEKEIGYNRIKSVYLGNYRIIRGNAPFGSNSVILERFSNLEDVAKSLLINLKTSKSNEEYTMMKE